MSNLVEKLKLNVSSMANKQVKLKLPEGFPVYLQTLATALLLNGMFEDHWL